jgi:CRP-like cAMP-binding protein
MRRDIRLNCCNQGNKEEGAPFKRISLPDPGPVLAQAGLNGEIVYLKKGQFVFSRGDRAEAVFYLKRGKVRLSVVASGGKELTIASLVAGDFIGEECVLSSHSLRVTTATAGSPVTLLRIERKEMAHALHEQPVLSSIFVSHVLARNARILEDPLRQSFTFYRKTSRPSAFLSRPLRRGLTTPAQLSPNE